MNYFAIPVIFLVVLTLVIIIVLLFKKHSERYEKLPCDKDYLISELIASVSNHNTPYITFSLINNISSCFSSATTESIVFTLDDQNTGPDDDSADNFTEITNDIKNHSYYLCVKRFCSQDYNNDMWQLKLLNKVVIVPDTENNNKILQNSVYYRMEKSRNYSGNLDFTAQLKKYIENTFMNDSSVVFYISRNKPENTC